MSIQRRLLARSLVSALAAICALSGAAMADSGTWTNNADGLWSVGPNWLGGTVADGAGNTAYFSAIDITNDMKVTVDTARTIGNLTFGDADTNSAAGWIVDRTGANTLTLANGAITVNPLGTGKSVEISVPLAGNAAITVKGGGTVEFSAVNTMTGAMNIGTTDNNNATFSAAGYTVPSPGTSFTVGNGFGNNTMTVRAGCIARWRAGGTVGINAGGHSNTLVVTGADAQVIIDNNGGSQFNLGVGGAKANHVVVSNGGYLRPQKFVIGRTGGTDNSALITGANSLVRVGQGNQGCLNVGTSVGGSARNSITIENGGYLLFESPEYKSGGSIGDSDGADDNCIVVKANATFRFFRTTDESLPFVIGAYNGRDGDHYQGFPIDSTGRGNHLDIVSGGAFVTERSSVYMMGVNSAMNLGDGNGISSATIGATAAVYNGNNYSPGIVLFKADSRLNFNSGRLTAGAPGKLVSGLGVVSNAGPAFVSTAYTNSIDCVITGPGSLTKEGEGTLTLTAANTYYGDTTVEDGVLGLDVPYLSDQADVYLVTGAKMDLTFNATDVVRQIYVDGVAQGGGNYGAGKRLSSFFVGDGPGVLRVLGKIGPTVIVR